MESSQDPVSAQGGAPQPKEKNRKSKRATQELYVPRARRQHAPTGESTPSCPKPAGAVDKPEGPQSGDTSSSPGVKQQPRKNEKRKGRDGGKGKQGRERRTSTDGEEGENKEAKERRAQNKGRHGRRADQQRYMPRPQREEAKPGKSGSKEDDTLPVGGSEMASCLGHSEGALYSQPPGNSQKSVVSSGGLEKQAMSGQSAISLKNASPVPEDWNEIDCDDRDVTCHPTGTRLTEHGKLIPVNPGDSTSQHAAQPEMEAGRQETKADEPGCDFRPEQNNPLKELGDNIGAGSEHCSSQTRDGILEVDDTKVSNNSEKEDISNAKESQDSIKEPNTSACNVSNIPVASVTIVDGVEDAAVCNKTDEDSVTCTHSHEQTESAQEAETIPASRDETSQVTLATAVSSEDVTQGRPSDQEVSAGVGANTDAVSSLSLNQEHLTEGAHPEPNAHSSAVGADEPQDGSLHPEASLRDDIPPTGNAVDETTETVQVEEKDSTSDILTDNQQTETRSDNVEDSGSVTMETDIEVSKLPEEKSNENCDDDAGDEDDWDAMFDESGDCLKPEEMQELSDGVGNVQVSVKQSKKDYYNYQPKDNTNYSELEHVIEVFDFPADFKTTDLIMGFSTMKSTKEMDIKWIDDTHALAIFPSAMIAQDALSISNPMFRTRPLVLASRDAKMKARQCQEFLMPSKPRPETSAAAARRLVSGALGLKANVSKEQRAAERQKIKDARDRRQSDKRQRENVWDGNI